MKDQELTVTFFLKSCLQPGVIGDALSPIFTLSSRKAKVKPGVAVHTSQLLKRQRKEDCEFGVSLGKVSQTLSQK
jgi:hypothetical protein